MPRKPKPNKQIVAFKVEPDLAALLDAMPNKSEFIRNAVARQLSTACPLCRGTGIAPFTGVTDELTRLVQQHPLCVCAGCGVKVPAPVPHARALRGGAAHRVVRALGRLLLRGVRHRACAFCTECQKPIGRAGARKKAVCDSCAAA